MKKMTGFLLGFLVWSLGVFAQTSGGLFSYGPDMNSTRIFPYVSQKPDGDVMVFGGRSNGFISSAYADLYSIETNTFTNLNMLYTHDNTVMVKLNDGRVLLAGGGFDYGVPAHQYAEIYNPNDNSFTAAGTMAYARMQGSGALLTDGKVLIVGGWYSPEAAANAELYDPVLMTSSYAGGLLNPRSNALVLPCNDGGALVIGGYPTYGGTTFNAVEYYNRETSSFELFSDEIISGETGWTTTLDPFYRKTTDMYILENGKYLLMLYRSVPTLEYTLALFDPENKSFEKVNTDYPLMGAYSDGGIIDYALNKEESLVYMLGVDNESGSTGYCIVTTDLSTGKTYQPDESYTMPSGEYLIFTTLSYIPETGMLLAPGVSTSNTDYFNATAKSFLIEPELKVDIPIQEDLIVLQVYPNPVKDMLMLILPSNIGGQAIVDICDMRGQILYRTNAFEGEKLVIPVNYLPTGNYILRVRNGNCNLSASFIRAGN